MNKLNWSYDPIEDAIEDLEKDDPSNPYDGDCPIEVTLDVIEDDCEEYPNQEDEDG